MHHSIRVLLPIFRPTKTKQAARNSTILICAHTFLAELKRLDDKTILIEVHLLESRVYRGLGIGNFEKAKVWSP